MNDLVRTGKLEMSKTFLGNLVMFDQRVQSLSLPWSFTGTADMLTALDGKAGDSIKAKLEAADLLLMGFFNAGPRNVYNTLRPVRVPGDLRGMRLRVPQDMVSLDAFNACGARTIPLAFNDITSALRNRFIDAAENSIIFFVSTGHSELAKFWSLTRHQVGIDALIISKLWFEGLARRDQAALEQAAAEAVPYERRLWLEKVDEYTTSITAQGVQTNDDVDVSAFQTVVAPVVAKYRPTLGDLAGLLPLL
jgi:TRAP-type C4-dicarboxylate transport system substrate-binding protein